MCLSYVSKEKPKKTGIGYKVFIRSTRFGVTTSRFSFQYMDLRGREEVPINKWLTAEKVPTWQGYQSGFHIFLNKEDAEKWVGKSSLSVIRKVRYRGARCQGRQRNCRVIIADKMFVPSLRKRT